MTFEEMLDQAIAMLQRRGRLSCRALKRQFDLDDDYLEDLKHEIVNVLRLAADQDSNILVWIGEEGARPEPIGDTPDPPDPPSTWLAPRFQAASLTSTSGRPEAERRQLTVMFCDLVGSTRLSGQLDPEVLREVIRAYQETAAEVIEQFDGHIAQYLGDGLLVYFGWPRAYEDAAQRAIYTGLGIVEAMETLNARLASTYDVQLAVRIGIDTGIVVVGEMGVGGRHEQLALGAPPNIAARLEGYAPPNTVVISAATAQLVRRAFVLEELGPHEFKGVDEPTVIACVVGPREADSDVEDPTTVGFSALVGRDEDIELLLRRWEQSQEGLGQVVLIRGEAGIGKSSLVEGLRTHVRQEGLTRMVFRCSPYTQHSALYPIIVHTQRLLGWRRDDSAETRLTKMEHVLEGYRLPLEEVVPLLAALLALPLPEEHYAALTLTPQQQRQQTLGTLVELFIEEVKRQPQLVVWEDLHWADPSSLKLLGLLMVEIGRVPLLMVLTFRPEFRLPWSMRSHMTSLTLSRLARPQVEAMLIQLAGGKALPATVVQHVVEKTDGVPLYTEELTKLLLESELLQEKADHYVLTGSLSNVAIPATLHDSLMARLDRLPVVREVAQLGAVLGREFSYEIIQALGVVAESTLQEGLSQLVDAELLQQQGQSPRTRYSFRHALIRDAAYQSLLRRTRQQYHQQVAQLYEARFPEDVERQPELVAYHYTEAELPELALRYWQRAGQRAKQGSAHVEAVAHFTTGLALLQTLPDTPERTQDELTFQTALGPSLMVTKGYAAPEVAQAYTRARELCQQVSDSPQLFSVLWGLFAFYTVRSELQIAHELADQLHRVAQRQHDPTRVVIGHFAFAAVLFFRAEFAAAREHAAQVMARYDRQQYRSLALLYGQDPGTSCILYDAWALWFQGYPAQAQQRLHEAVAMARDMGHPYSLAYALSWTARFYISCGEVEAGVAHAEATLELSTEQGFGLYVAAGMMLRGWAWVGQGQCQDGIALMHQGLDAWRATGAEMALPYYIALLAEVYGCVGQAEEGIGVLDEALAAVEKTEERYYEAELYQLKGKLLLHQLAPDAQRAETCFQQALHVARRQHAKFWELRAATSLARLWQREGKRQEAYDLLAPVYSWFTEGFDTADLQEAKSLLEELG